MTHADPDTAPRSPSALRYTRELAEVKRTLRFQLYAIVVVAVLAVYIALMISMR